jgi:hypothetical protein
MLPVERWYWLIVVGFVAMVVAAAILQALNGPLRVHLLIRHGRGFAAWPTATQRLTSIDVPREVAAPRFVTFHVEDSLPC